MTGARIAGGLLAVAAAACGLAVAFGMWAVGYCGSLTPDVAPSGSLRSDLCRGTSGDLVGVATVVIWALAVAAPLAGALASERRARAWPLVAGTALSAVLLGTVAILAKTLPQ